MKRTNRKKWWNFILSIFKIFKRKPKFVLLGDKLEDQSIYLCNHVGASGPLTLELYFPKLFRSWGTYEMNEGMKERFKYLSTTYFHQKKHLPKFLAFFISIFATPLMTLFYKGIRLISTYKDIRLVNAFKQSFETLDKNESIVIFPEDSSNGYFEHLTKYFPGFVMLAEKSYARGDDLLIYNMYYQKKNNIIVVDNPIRYSEIKKWNLSREEVAEKFRVRANELGEMKFNKKELK